MSIIGIEQDSSGEPRSEEDQAIEKRTEQKATRKRRWGPALPPTQINVKEHNSDSHHERNTTVHEDDLSLKRFKEFRRGRSSSTARHNHPTFDRRHKGTWRCLVCYLWNDNERYQCRRCGASEGVDEDEEPSHEGDRFDIAYKRHRRDRSPGRYGTRGARREPYRGSTSRRRSASAPMANDWPPLFESNASLYVLDSRCGMFYESESDFFYDPKSKLYYSNRKGAYFRHDESQHPPFQKVTESSSHEEPPSKSQESPAATKTKSSGGVISIPIKIKSTKQSLSQKRGRSAGAMFIDLKRKSQTSEFDKWEERKKEKESARPQKALSEPASRQQVQGDQSAVRSMSNQRELNAPNPAPLKTVDGLPICALCRRKFESIELLRRHELHSELHKTNMAKAQKATAQSISPAHQQKARTEQPVATYSDRARKRRQLHGDLHAVAPQRATTFASKEKMVHTALEPAAILGQSNVGNRLFNKMVAKSSSPGVVAEGAIVGSLRRDWQRIEAIAKGRGDPSKFGTES